MGEHELVQQYDNQMSLETGEPVAKLIITKKGKSMPSLIKHHSGTGRWTEDEHLRFLQGLREYGKDWAQVSAAVSTRTIVQTRTHAQKFILKLKKSHAENKQLMMDGLPIFPDDLQVFYQYIERPLQRRKVRSQTYPWNEPVGMKCEGLGRRASYDGTMCRSFDYNNRYNFYPPTEDVSGLQFEDVVELIEAISDISSCNIDAMDSSVESSESSSSWFSSAYSQSPQGSCADRNGMDFG